MGTSTSKAPYLSFLHTQSMKCFKVSLSLVQPRFVLKRKKTKRNKYKSFSDLHIYLHWISLHNLSYDDVTSCYQAHHSTALPVHFRCTTKWLIFFSLFVQLFVCSFSCPLLLPVSVHLYLFETPFFFPPILFAQPICKNKHIPNSIYFLKSVS